MDLYKLREKLLLGLQSVVLVNGDELKDRLSIDEIKDVANTLVNYLPKNNQAKMIDLQSQIFSNLHGMSTPLRLYKNEDIKTLLEYDVSTIKHKLFNSMYLLFLLGENIDDSFNELFTFYNSFTINSLDLRDEVQANPTDAVSNKINETQFVRTDKSTGKFIPTKLTNKQFKHLL